MRVILLRLFALMAVAAMLTLFAGTVLFLFGDLHPGNELGWAYLGILAASIIGSAGIKTFE